MDTDCTGWGPCFGVHTLRWFNVIDVNSNICSRYLLMIWSQPETGFELNHSGIMICANII